MEYGLRMLSVLCSAFFLFPLNAAQLGQITVADPALGSKTITYEPINGYAIVEGDIILGKLAHMNNPSAVITTKIGGSRWPNNMVAYEISEDLPFLNKLAIYQAIDHWQEHSKIKFVELTSKNHNDYADYISFIPSEDTTCASFVGRQKGKQIIELAPRCHTMITVHEIGHALGLWHEQSRADRDSFIRIAWENIDEKHKFNFEQHLTDGNDFGDYDFQSIMHYGPYAFSKNGKQTIVPLIEGVEIGQRNHLSDKDVAAINAMYPEDKG